MSGIDYSNAEFWAKAPEWAGAVVTAYSSDGDRFYFVEEFGGISRRQEVGSIYRGEIADMIIPGNLWRLVAERPQSWTGAGLPPVGTILECRFAVDPDTWHHGTVIHKGMQPEGVEFCMVDTGEYQACYRGEGGWMRPLRTAEQIAAEERELFAKTLVFEMGRGSDQAPSSMNQARRMYDLGYRKQADRG
jgi:hypothetical protein